MRIKVTINLGGITRIRDFPKRVREGVERGLDEAGAMFVKALQRTAPGRDLKRSISFIRRGLTLEVGSFDGPPWATISEFGGDIHAKRFSFYIHNIRQTVGPLLQIPFNKESRGQPGIRILSRAGNIVKLAYDPGSKTVGGPIAVLKPMVHHPAANSGKGWLFWVIEANKPEAIALVRGEVRTAAQAA